MRCACAPCKDEATEGRFCFVCFSYFSEMGSCEHCDTCGSRVSFLTPSGRQMHERMHPVEAK